MCEVCHEPIIDISKLPPALREKVYVPEEPINIQVDLGAKKTFGAGDPTIGQETDEVIPDE